MHRISCLKSILTFLTPDEQMKSISTNIVYFHVFKDKIVIYFLQFGYKQVLKLFLYFISVVSHMDSGTVNFLASVKHAIFISIF